MAGIEKNTLKQLQIVCSWVNIENVNCLVHPIEKKLVF